MNLSNHSALENIILQNISVKSILADAHKLDLRDWYIGAGVIAQTVWNIAHAFPAEQNIKDIDIAYFDPSDLSEESEKQTELRIQTLFRNLPLKLDVKNQARVHIWYERRFGYPIKPYQSVEQAIKTWPTTSTCIGIRVEKDSLRVYAPYGLDDLLGLIVRPNKVQITESIYNSKADRWSKSWPKLKIMPWSESNEP